MKRPQRIDRRHLLLAGSAAILSRLAPSDALAQDAAQARPEAFRVVFENDRTRVLEFVSRPGTELCGTGRHSHPAHLTVALSDARVRVTLPDGSRIDATNKVGDVFWSEPETHAVENIGGGTVRALIIEIKDAPTARG